MALHQRRDASGRTRFLLALTLSTVTAVGVAAPLAIQAIRADEVKVAGNPDLPNTQDATDDESIDRSLTSEDGNAKGGIGSREPGKAVAQTSKSETQEARPTSADAPDAAVLTNPEPEDLPPAPAADSEAEPEPQPEPQPEPEPTTTTTAPTTTASTATSTTETTVADDTTTTTTDPDSSTSSSETTSTTDGVATTSTSAG